MQLAGYNGPRAWSSADLPHRPLVMGAPRATKPASTPISGMNGTNRTTGPWPAGQILTAEDLKYRPRADKRTFQAPAKTSQNSYTLPDLDFYTQRSCSLASFTFKARGFEACSQARIRVLADSDRIRPRQWLVRHGSP